jgi:hypothetical protein
VSQNKYDSRDLYLQEGQRMSNDEPGGVKPHELDACRERVENKILFVEQQMMNKIENLQEEVKFVREALKELLTRKEWEPYRLVIVTILGGALMAVVGGLMAMLIGGKP